MATDNNSINGDKDNRINDGITPADNNPTSQMRLVKPVIFGLIITGIIVLCLYLLQGGSYDSSDFHNVDPVEEAQQPDHEEISLPTEETTLSAEETALPAEDTKEEVPVPTANPQSSTEVSQKKVNSLEGYSVGFGKYSGPAENGKPSGAGGSIKVTEPFTIDQKNGKEGLQVEPGDEIIDCKYRDGKLIQGKIIKKSGESKFFSIGI